MRIGHVERWSHGVDSLDADSLLTKMPGKVETIDTMLVQRGIVAGPSSAPFVSNIASYTIGRMPPRNAGASRVGTTKAAAGSLWALDFDGVVCDSVGESSLSAWQASAELWPDLFAQPAVQERREEILNKMRTVRPVVETGYENLVQVRCLLDDMDPQNMLANWHQLLPACMQRWGLHRSELVERFGAMRDGWIARDLPGWLAANGIYAGLPEVLQQLRAAHELYIVTTKQARFTEALLHNAANLPLPPERIFSTAETGQPKSEVLLQLHARHPGAECHFVEDKLSTLEKVAKVPELAAWNLYLVDWGYNTEAERSRAAADPRIELVDLAGLSALIK